MPELRCTRAALNDLGLDPAVYARLPAGEYTAAHAVVRAFVERRGQDPQAGETTRLPTTAVTVYNLHVERYRGLTWHDEEDDIVWLLGVGYHRQGDRSDAYRVLKQRDQRSALLPTEEDYQDLEADRESLASFLRSLSETAGPLLEEARIQEGHWATARISDVMDISVGVERLADGELLLEDVYIVLHMPPKAGVLPPYPEWLTVTLAALLPTAAIEELDFSAELPFPFPTEVGTDCHVVRWRRDGPGQAR